MASTNRVDSRSWRSFHANKRLPIAFVCASKCGSLKRGRTKDGAFLNQADRLLAFLVVRLAMAKQKSQIEKFREAAKEADTDESERRFNERLKEIARKKPETEPKPDGE